MKKLKKLSDAAKRTRIVEMIDTLHTALDIEEDFKITKKTKESDLLAILSGEAALIQPSDKIDKGVIQHLEELDVTIGSEGEPDEDDPEPDEDDLAEVVEDATKLGELKALVKDHDEFKKLRKKIATFKKVKDLKEVMLEMLSPDEDDEDPPEEKKEKGKKDKKGKDKKAEKEEDKKPKRPAAKKGERMTDHLDGLIEKGGTFNAICKKAQKEGDKRGLAQKWTAGSIRSHIKFRESQQKGWLKKKGKVQTEKGIEDK